MKGQIILVIACDHGHASTNKSWKTDLATHLIVINTDINNEHMGSAIIQPTEEHKNSWDSIRLLFFS